MSKIPRVIAACLLLNSISAPFYAYAVDGVVYDAPFTYQSFDYPGTGSGTFFTGIRGDTVTGNYTITGTDDTGGILYSQLHGTWTNFPEDTPPVNLSGASSNTSYSANWGTYGNTLIAVGTYKNPSYSNAYDLSYIYNANTPSSPITYLDVPVNLKGDSDTSATLFTFVHSISGNFVVGNYDTKLATGNSFIYNLSATTGSSPVAAHTYQPLQIPDSVSTTTYGVYGRYIAGGFANLTDDINTKSVGLNHGFIAKIDLDGKITNSLELNHPRAVFTHFEGITGGGKAGHFNLVADYIDSTGQVHASYAHVVWDGTNDLSHPNNSVKWFDYAVPEGTVTSANSGYQSTVVGIYEAGTTAAYIGTVGNVTENGTTHLIYDPFATNTGTITTTANNENGIDASVYTIYGNEYNDVINSGTITTSGTVAHGIISSGYGVITNTGTIAVSGNQSNAVRLIANDSTLLNYGTIKGNYTAANADDERNYTIRALIAPGASITNFSSGVISYSGLEGAAILLDESSGSFVDNQGLITATGDSSVGILAIATTDNTGIGNSGTIQAVGANAAGIWSQHDAMNINNSGTIIATTTGVYIGQNSSLTNSGLIQATDSAGTAILAAGNNNTVTLNQGSIIRGAIASTGTGNALNVNLGLSAAQSYAYTTSGDWNFTDADSATRPAAFAASAGAASAGIGVQETAGEMLYEHTSAISQSLTRQVLNPGNSDVWVDPYYSRNTRDASTTNPDISKFSNDSFGVTAGFKTPVEVTRVDAIANVQTADLNIQDSSQKVSATSIMLGLSTPTLYQFRGITLSAKALAGYTDYSGDREVITNTGSGSEEVTSDYSSYSGMVGTQLTRIFPLNALLSANIVTGVDLAVEKYNSHTESAYFAFDDRTLTQLSSHIDGGLEAKTADGKLAVFGRVGLANRRLLDGHQASYQINGVEVTFDGGKETDTYVTEQIGARYTLAPETDLVASLGAGQSINDVRSLQGTVGVNIKF